MKTSLISFSSLFLKSQFSTSTSIAPKSSTSSKLFYDEKDMPIERYVSGSNECVLLNTPNFCGCESVCHDVIILAVNKSAPLNTDAKIKRGDGFSICKWLPFIFTHYAYFNKCMAFILPNHLLLGVSGIKFQFQSR